MQFGVISRHSEVELGDHLVNTSLRSLHLISENKRHNNTRHSIHHSLCTSQTSDAKVPSANISYLPSDDQGKGIEGLEIDPLSKNTDVQPSGLSLSSGYNSYQKLTLQDRGQFSGSLVPSPLETNPKVKLASVPRNMIQHPTPDLQILQGGRLRAIEHLERTAELLSKDPHSDDKVRDSSNALDSLPIRLSSKNVLASRLEHAIENRPPDSLFNKLSLSTCNTPYKGNENSTLAQKYDPFSLARIQMNKTQRQSVDATRTQEKENSQIKMVHTESKDGVTSNEISPTEILEKLFEDFDGTHHDQVYSDHNLTSSSENQNLEKFSSEDQLSPNLQEEQNMVFYPAPVPTMLNLPKKLSKRPTSILCNNRISCSISRNNTTQNLISSQSESVRQELRNDKHIHDHLQSPTTSTFNIERQRESRDMSNLPPELRASMFFEQQSPVREVVELRDQSAVATLDSILDASANTPVNAFTDHIFVGNLGPEVYGKARTNRPKNLTQTSETEKKRRSSWSFTKLQRSKSNENMELSKHKEQLSASNRRSFIDANSEPNNSDEILRLDPSIDEGASVSSPEENQAEGEQSSDDAYLGQPTTLLAELQLRKKRQKQRTQPFTKTFPNGIHSTLLELDTAIQAEQKTRRKFRPILAWEDPAVFEAQTAMQDDDDVPLAILYSKNSAKNQPLGLLERRALEENEPLSQRRNRLRRQLGNTQPMNITTSENRNVTHEVEEQETLRDRAKRLKAVNLPVSQLVSDEFGSSLREKFMCDLPKSKSKENLKEGPQKFVPQEETLGQRRIRLQAEQVAGVSDTIKDFKKQQPLQSSDPWNQKFTADPYTAPINTTPILSQDFMKSTGSLLEIHEKQAALRSASLHHLKNSNASVSSSQLERKSLHNPKGNLYKESTSHILHRQPPQYQSAPYPQLIPPHSVYQTQSSLISKLGINHSYGDISNTATLSREMCSSNNNNSYHPLNPKNSNLYMANMNINMIPMNITTTQSPLEQGQMDMVEKWRQSILPLSKPGV